MKTALTTLLATLILCSRSFAAEEKRPTAQLTFHVATDEGEAVEGAEIWAATFQHWQPGEGFGKDIKEEMRGKTDAEGNVTLTFQSLRGDLSYGASGGDTFLSHDWTDVSV